jgi:redox-sensing transcriptional repressor
MLFKALGRFLDAPDCQNAALVGIGRLGSAILAYFLHRSIQFKILAAFDRDPRRTTHPLFECPCHPLDRMQDVIQEQQIRIAILAVPAGAVQAAADSVVTAGVRGIVNFAPVPLHVSPDVFVENMDITATLEKVAFFAQAHRNQSTLAGKSA